MDVKNRRLHLTNIIRHEFTPTKTSYLLTNSTPSFSRWACAIVWQARLGNNAFFSIKEFVIGLRLCPMLNHRSIDVLSYVCLSSATTGSWRSSWVMGQTSSRYRFNIFVVFILTREFWTIKWVYFLVLPTVCFGVVLKWSFLEVC